MIRVESRIRKQEGKIRKVDTWCCYEVAVTLQHYEVNVVLK